MNSYKAVYTWTEPTEDCPFVTYKGSHVVCGDDLADAKEGLELTQRCHSLENFHIKSITLEEEDIHTLKTKADSEGKYIEGYCALIERDDYTFVIMARTKSILTTISGLASLDESKIKFSKIREGK